MVFSGLIRACRFAASPTRRTPFFVIATTEGVVRAPSALGITMGTPPSTTATQELVVPRSMPITFDLPYLDVEMRFHGKPSWVVVRSEEHTSELQSRVD